MEIGDLDFTFTEDGDFYFEERATLNQKPSTAEQTPAPQMNQAKPNERQCGKRPSASSPRPSNPNRDSGSQPARQPWESVPTQPNRPATGSSSNGAEANNPPPRKRAADSMEITTRPAAEFDATKLTAKGQHFCRYFYNKLIKDCSPAARKLVERALTDAFAPEPSKEPNKKLAFLEAELTKKLTAAERAFDTLTRMQLEAAQTVETLTGASELTKALTLVARKLNGQCDTCRKNAAGSLDALVRSK